jgi:hypothetical protein
VQPSDVRRYADITGSVRFVEVAWGRVCDFQDTRHIAALEFTLEYELLK